MRKVIGFTMAIAMCMSLYVPSASAVNIESNNEPQMYTASEYDMLIAMKQDKESLEEAQNLMPSSIDEDEQEYLNELQTFSPENAIMEFASQPYDELKKQGYTTEQIEILKEYDGSPIEDNPQLSRALGKLSASLSRRAYSDYSAGARLYWNWTTKPIITGVFTDIVACAWRGINQNNEESVLTFVPELSECEVEYFNDYGESVDRVVYEINDKDPNRNAEVKFPLTHDMGYAKKGYFDVYLEEENIVHELDTAVFIFAYGHTNFTISPSISVSGSGPSLGLSCAFGTDEMFNEWIKVKSSGRTDVSYT